MKAILKRDFSPKSYWLYLHSNHDVSGIRFFIHSAGYEEIGPNYHLRRSEFFCNMLTYIVGGSGYLIYRGKKYELKRNSAILINCMDEHILYPGPRGMTIYYLHIESYALDRFVSYMNELNGPVVNFFDDFFIYHHVKEIVESIRDKKANDDQLSLKLYECFLYFRSFKDVGKDVLTQAPATIRYAVRYIDENYAKSISLETIANTLSVSKFHLEKMFQKYLQSSVCKYLSEVRLKKAQELLLNTDDPIETIANAVGLYDSQSIIRLFKKYVNETPLQYRKRRQM